MQFRTIDIRDELFKLIGADGGAGMEIVARKYGTDVKHSDVKISNTQTRPTSLREQRLEEGQTAVPFGMSIVFASIYNTNNSSLADLYTVYILGFLPQILAS